MALILKYLQNIARQAAAPHTAPPAATRIELSLSNPNIFVPKTIFIIKVDTNIIIDTESPAKPTDAIN